MYWYLEVLRKYAVFSGRARRKEFWMFALVNFIVSFAIGVLGNILGMSEFNVPSMLYSLVILIPSLAVSIRRMHDIDKSGLWILIALLPFVGWIWYIILACREGNPDANEYGPNPKLSPDGGMTFER